MELLCTSSNMTGQVACNYNCHYTSKKFWEEPIAYFSFTQLNI
jgi:hypothetical protein